MKIGDRIAQYRKVRGLTQGQLGEKIGVVKQTVGNYERGDRQPTHDIILKITNVLDVDPAKLYGMPIQDANDAATPGERLTNYMVVFGDSAADLSLLLNISLEDVGRICADDLDLTPEQAAAVAERYGHISPSLFLSETYDEFTSPSNVRPISVFEESDNAEETELVSIYRNLNSIGQSALIGTARGLAANPDMKKGSKSDTETTA